MKKNMFFIAATVTLLFGLAACNGGGTTTKMPKLSNELDSMNYAYGYFTGAQLQMMLAQDSDSVDYKVKQLMEGIQAGMKGTPDENPQFEQVGGQVGGWLNQQKTVGVLGDSTIKINYNLVKQGLINGIKGFKSHFTAEEAMAFIDGTMRKRQEEQMMKLHKDKKEAGDKFIAENAKKPGITTTASGLQYEIIKQGNGAKPTPAEMVKVHYSGTLIDGTKFDSSYDRNEPATFGVGQVIPGWTEGLQLMPVGSKFKFYIPQNLAYGAQGSQGIPPFSPLVFEVELLEIVK